MITSMKTKLNKSDRHAKTEEFRVMTSKLLIQTTISKSKQEFDVDLVVNR